MARDMIRNPYQLKSLMDELRDRDDRGEMYHFTPANAPDGPVYVYLVAQALAYAHEHMNTLLLQANPDEAEALYKARGIDPCHAEDVVQAREAVEEDWPVLVSHWTEDNTHVLFDGAHRMVAHGMRGPTVRPAYIFKQKFLMQRGMCVLMSRKFYNSLNVMGQE